MTPQEAFNIVRNVTRKAPLTADEQDLCVAALQLVMERMNAAHNFELAAAKTAETTPAAAPAMEPAPAEPASTPAATPAALRVVPSPEQVLADARRAAMEALETANKLEAQLKATGPQPDAKAAEPVAAPVGAVS